MKKKHTKQKKETTLSVLQDIRALLQVNNIEIEGIKQPAIQPVPKPNELTFILPTITAKEIYEQSGNKTSKGTPLIYSTWMLKEPFFTTETTRPGTVVITKDILHKGKSYAECKELLEKDGGEVLNFAEWLYILWQHEKATGERLFSGYEYTWTSSLVGAGDVSCVGHFGEDGLNVGSWLGERHGDVGVGASRRI